MANLDKANNALKDATANAVRAVGDAHGAATKVGLSSSQVLIGMCGFSIGGGAPWVIAAFTTLGAATAAPLSLFGAVLGVALAGLVSRGPKVIRRELTFHDEARHVDALIERRSKFKLNSPEYNEITEEIRATNRRLFVYSPPLALPAPSPKLPAPAPQV